MGGAGVGLSIYTVFSLAQKKDDARSSPTGAVASATDWFNVSENVWITTLILSGILTTVILLVVWDTRKQSKQVELAEIAERVREFAAIEEATDKLKERMELPSLVNLNRLVLDRYHGIATEQADSSFTSSRRAMWLGFAWLLGCFAVATLVPGAERSQLLIGSLAVIGGTLSAFLSKTYIRVYERSLLQLNRYFEQPLLNSYLLSAERIIQEMESGKADAYRAVLNRLLKVGEEATDQNGAGDSDSKRRRRRPSQQSRDNGHSDLSSTKST